MPILTEAEERKFLKKSVDDTMNHEDWNNGIPNYDYDIALLHLDSEISSEEWNYNIKMVCLAKHTNPTHKTLFDGKHNSIMTGFGISELWLNLYDKYTQRGTSQIFPRFFYDDYEEENIHLEVLMWGLYLRAKNGNVPVDEAKRAVNFFKSEKIDIAQVSSIMKSWYARTS